MADTCCLPESEDNRTVAGDCDEVRFSRNRTNTDECTSWRRFAACCQRSPCCRIVDRRVLTASRCGWPLKDAVGSTILSSSLCSTSEDQLQRQCSICHAKETLMSVRTSSSRQQHNIQNEGFFGVTFADRPRSHIPICSRVA